MVAIPKKLLIEHLIEDTIIDDANPRPYLGLSGIGNSCLLALWLSFRWASMGRNQITPRQKRIFARGDLEEERVITDLKGVGVVVEDQQLEIIGFAGHVKGHIDGTCINVPDAPKTKHLLEIKTANAKNFKPYPDKGCEEANYVYYCQQQIYMHRLGLTRSLFIVTNKDTEARHYERIYYDKELGEELEAKSQEVIMSEFPPHKNVSYKCNWCNHKAICQEGAEYVKTCRTCKFVDLEKDGMWRCSIDGLELSYERQLIGCDSYGAI